MRRGSRHTDPLMQNKVDFETEDLKRASSNSDSVYLRKQKYII